MAYQGQDLTNYQAGNYYLPQLKYSLPYDAPTAEEDQTATATGSGIPYTKAFTNSGGGDGGGGVGPLDPYTAQTSGSYVTNRTNFGNTGYIQGTEPEETYMDRIGGYIKRGIGMAIPGANFLMGMAPSRQKRLNATDNAFIDMQLANQEQSMHGGNLTNQDRYGFNKESMFGNYADKVKERADIARRKAKENIDDPNYKVRPIDAYYLEKEKEQEDIDKQIEFNNFMNQRVTANKLRELEAKGFKNYPSGGDIHGDGDTTTTTTTTDQKQTGDGGGTQDQGGYSTRGGFTGEKDPTSGGVRGHHGAAQGGRIGYNRGRVVNPGGYAGDTDFTTWLQKQDIDIKTLNLDDLTSLQLEWDKIRPKHLDQADGGRVRFFYGGIATAL